MLLLCKNPSNLGFGPGPQLLQFLGSCFNSCRSSQQLILCDDSWILRVHPLCACRTHNRIYLKVLHLIHRAFNRLVINETVIHYHGVFCPLSDYISQHKLSIEVVYGIS